MIARKIAAIPDEVAIAAVPPSKAATLSSSTPTVGLEILLYICPPRSRLNSAAA